MLLMEIETALYRLLTLGLPLRKYYTMMLTILFRFLAQISMSVYLMLVGVTLYAPTFKDLTTAIVNRASRAQVVVGKIVLVRLSRWGGVFF